MTTHLVVIGLGYVGLPLAQAAAEAGLRVTGLDVDDRVVKRLNEGHSHIQDITDEAVATMLGADFRATTEAAVIGTADVVVVCVPTPLAHGGGPDLTALDGAVAAIASNLQRGMLVVLESTTYPGTTEERAQPLLEEVSGLKAGEDFHLAFSPERIDPGNSRFGLRNTPKVVGGLSQRCGDAAVSFYSQFVETVVRAAGTREAEMAKLLENTYRHINIALVNEMAKFCHELEVDLWDVIRCAGTKPFGFQPFFPGPGVGGHCIPIDPNYLNYQVRSKLGRPFKFVELAEEINASMPTYVGQRIEELLRERGRELAGARVLLLGVTYKPNISDQRESPARPLAVQLVANGAELSFHDPYVESWDLSGVTVPRANELVEAVRVADVVVLLQNHADYDVDYLASLNDAFFDTRGVASLSDVARL